jgi:hypothetical protein
LGIDGNDPMTKTSVQIQGIVLYQQEGVIASRLPGAVEALAVYIRSLQQALERHYRAAPIHPAGRALVAPPSGRGIGTATG